VVVTGEAFAPDSGKREALAAVAAAWKGAVYVHAEADADRPPLVAAVDLIVAHACGAVSGPPRWWPA
jgi:hypothetical protein